jgi:mannose/fructose/N-acetylgalactosamine-specific phosphotransferase system component IID
MYIQAAWNFRGLLNLGFAQAMAPAVCRLFRDRRKRTECLKRHLNFFLSNPYFATYAVGACIRLEEQFQETGNPNPEQIESFKRAIGSPLASLGDSLIWGALRPAMLLVGVILALTGTMWGPVVFLVGYNLPTLAVRIVGLSRGYALGFGVVREIASPLFNRATAAFRFLAAIGLGVVAAIAVDTIIGGGSAGLVRGLPVVALIILGRMFRASFYMVLILCLLIFIGLGYI